MAKKSRVVKGLTRTKPKAAASKATGSTEVASKAGKDVLALKVVPDLPLDIKDLGVGDGVPRPTGAKAANTIVYVHGIGQKPTASVLKCQWDTALFGAQLGDRSRMAYWMNRDYYEPSEETCGDADLGVTGGEEMAVRTLRGFAVASQEDENRVIGHEIDALTDDPARRQFLRSIAGKMAAASASAAPPPTAKGVGAKVLPVPDFLRRLVTRGLTLAFLRDVYDFFFVEERRKAMEDALMERLAGGGGPFVVIGHSQGSMIAYNVLRRLDMAKYQVPLFITIGSPLGIDEVQAVFRQWTGGSLPFPNCVGKWVNVADTTDPVALDPDISDEFSKPIENHARFRLNADAPEHPHSATGYLRTKFVQAPVRDTVGTAFQQSITAFALSKDLTRDLEDEHADFPHEVLIQLAGEQVVVDLDEVAEAVEARIRHMVSARPDKNADAKIERLRHFIAAELTRQELETIRSHFKTLQIKGVWRNASKRALIAESTNTVQARPANLGYGADGSKIAWAVLDTGIRGDHPHFGTYGSIVEQWDCTRPGAPERSLPGTTSFNELDGNGHGTHVAGIIAGESQALSDNERVTFSGMAPRCSLYGFKVLDNGGHGKDSWIIKGLDRVAAINERAGKLVIHGVNLSLGGSFDPGAFGCGHTPLCQEIRRLWQQGVLVCLAAGNEGYAVLASSEGDIQANLDLTIGDPANLEEAIAVGSVHKTNPHTYGISYFSSRGPTADGRRKPDVVAPGERVLSARHDWNHQAKTRERSASDLFVEMSGTSMAAPHVSGVLAAFLSLRREFIGYPDRVKSILTASCVDLRRDPYMQGAGLPNLIKMLALN